MLLANFLFAGVDTSTKWLLASGLFVLQLAFMRYAVHFAIAAAQRLIEGKGGFSIPRAARGWVALRSFCLVSATMVNFLGLKYLSLSVTAALLYLSPLFICLFAAALLGERISRHDWIGVVLGMIGAVLVVWPFGEAVNWIALIMLYPAAAMALYQVLSRKLAPVVRPGPLQLATGALGTAMLTPLVFLNWTPPGSASAWTLLIALGVLAWAGHEALTRAFAHAPASALAPFGYSFVVYLTLAGLILFRDPVSLNVAVGALMIFGAGLYAWQGLMRNRDKLQG